MLTLFVKTSKSSVFYRFTIQIQLSTILSVKCQCMRQCMLLKQKMFSLKLIGQTGGKKKADKLPEWSNACRKALLFQPSSAASEKVFFLFCLIFFPIDMKDLLETTYRPLLWFSIIQNVSNCINQLLLYIEFYIYIMSIVLE